MKRWTALLTALLLLLSLAGCGSAATGEETAEVPGTEQSITGQVTAIEGTQVTLQLGELTQLELDGEMPTELPEGMEPPENAGERETPPELPEGEEPPENTGDGENPPELPEGDAPAGMSSFTAGEETATLDLANVAFYTQGPEGQAESSLDQLQVDDILVIALDEGGDPVSATIQQLGGMGGGPGQGVGSDSVEQGSAANTIDTDQTVSETAYTSSGADENALRVEGATVTLTDITVEKSGGDSSNTESGDFYGMNAAFLATGGAQVTIENAVVTTSAQNGNGVFSYGEGTAVTISDSQITTTGDNSGGIQTTGGGATYARDLTISTAGNSSAAIRSDRGGGTVQVEGGSYATEGYNSPAVYSTAAITVEGAELTAGNSEALVIEGANSLALTDCQVTGNMSEDQGASSAINVHTVMIYQSMSGDAQVGTASFSMTGGTLTGETGDLFYVTNTHCLLTLSGVELENRDEEGALLRVSGNDASNGWGTAGANGAQVEFTADGQTMAGDIVVDSISTLALTLKNGSSWTGCLTIEENADGGQAVEDNATVILEEGCTWTLTGDCTLTTLTNHGTIQYNGYTITLADGTVLSA